MVGGRQRPWLRRESPASPGTAGRRTERCGCCGRQLSARRVTELGVTPGVFICARCALWAARRAGVVSAWRQIPLRSLLPRLGRLRTGHMVRAIIPILPSTDLGRTAAFYAPVGFAESERHHGYLLLHSGGVELHFAHHDTVTPGACFLRWSANAAAGIPASARCISPRWRWWPAPPR